MVRKSNNKPFGQFSREQKRIIKQFELDMRTDATLQGLISELSKIQDTESEEFQETNRKILNYLDTTCQQRLKLLAPTEKVPQKQ